MDKVVDDGWMDGCIVLNWILQQKRVSLDILTVGWLLGVDTVPAEGSHAPFREKKSVVDSDTGENLNCVICHLK